ncbi:MAG: hypothetical protein AAF411_23065, partial [Myxococcota bacterium]
VGEAGEGVPKMAVRGRWTPPADVIAASRWANVEVVDPPPLRPLGSCSGPDLASDWCTHPACSGAHPGTQAIAEYIIARWPDATNLGVAGCRRNTNNGAYLSVHAIGRAIDIGIPLADGDANNGLGDQIANWLVTNARHIGIQRVGWDGSWFNGENGFGARMCSRSCGDADYPWGCWPCNPHVDHLHIEVSLDAAAQRTAFFTVGPPTDTCEPGCRGTSSVLADCSFVDCAAIGQVCAERTGRCAPIEPPRSVRNDRAELPRLNTIGSPLRFSFVNALRLFDTREARLSRRLRRSDGSTGALSRSVSGLINDWSGLPSGAQGAWLNVAAVANAQDGFVLAYPEGRTPNTSSLNFEASTVRSNAVPVRFGSERGVRFDASSNVHVIADAVAAFGASGSGLRSVDPRRVIDSRSLGNEVRARSVFRVDAQAPDEATGVTATVTVLSDEQGFATVYPCDVPRPDTSSVNFMGRGPVANTVVSELSADGEICIWSIRDAHFVVDVNGFFVSSGELSYQPLQPVRLLDTRDESSLYHARLGDGQTIELPIQSLVGAPAAIQSVLVNLVAVNTDSAGFVSIFPCGFDVSATSSLNFGYGRRVVTAAAMSTVGGGKLCARSLNRTDLIVDLLGVWVPTPGGPAPTPSEPTPDPTDPDAPAAPDAPTPGADAGATTDAGARTFDAGMPMGDVGTPPADPPESGGSMLEGGCSAQPAGGVGCYGALLLGLLCIRRRRRARPTL